MVRIKKRKNSTVQNLKMVLSDKKYLILFSVTSILLFLLLAISMEIVLIVFPRIFLFSTGMLAFSGIEYLVLGLLFLFSVPIIIGLATTMNVYRFFVFRARIKKEAGASFLGTISGILLAGCPQCVPLVLSIFGVSITTWLSFFSGYGIVLWLLTISVSIFSLYLASSKFNEECEKCKV